MAAFISTPKNIPFWLRIGIWFSERVTGHEMLPAKLLSLVSESGNWFRSAWKRW